MEGAKTYMPALSLPNHRITTLPNAHWAAPEVSRQNKTQKAKIESQNVNSGWFCTLITAIPALILLRMTGTHCVIRANAIKATWRVIRPVTLHCVRIRFNTPWACRSVISNPRIATYIQCEDTDEIDRTRQNMKGQLTKKKLYVHQLKNAKIA